MHYWLWLLALAVLIGSFLSLLLVHGLPCTDGMVYASMARNLAAGHGSFWQPYFTEYHASKFFDHPALAISWQAWAYKVFGDHVAIEKIYSFIITLFNWLLLYALAKRFMPYLRWYHAWILLFAWLMVPTNPWAYASNMLEPVANVFALIALYLIVVSYQQRQRGWKLFISILVAGVSTCIGVYVNGPLVLYIWLVEPCLYFVYQQEKIGRSSYRWLLLIVVTLLAFAAFVPAHANFMQYWHQQVVAALENKRINSMYFGMNRLAIVYITFIVFVPNFILATISYMFTAAKPTRQAKRNAVFFVLLFIASVFPIMASSKQFYHYALQGYPYVQFALAVLLLPAIFAKLDEWFSRPKLALVFKVILVVLPLLSIVWMAFVLTHQNRFFHNYYSEAQAVIKLLGPNKVIGMPYVGLMTPAEFETYLQRYGKISIRQEKHLSSKYVITIPPFIGKVKMPANYHLAPLTSSYKNCRLYIKQ